MKMKKPFKSKQRQWPGLYSRRQRSGQAGQSDNGAQTEFAAAVDFQNRADIFLINDGIPAEFFIAET
jgi:hypothetical protein